MKTITITSVAVPQATGTLTSNNTAPTNNKVVVIGSKTYTFKSALTPAEGEVFIGTGGGALTADQCLLNLIRAINHSGTPGTDYKCAAANTQVTAATSVTAHAFVITSIETGLDGNSIVTTTDESTLSWGAATLTGGNTISFSGTVADSTWTQPAQRVTVPDLPSANTNWSRAIRATSEVMRVDRVGIAGVAMTLASWGKLGYSVEPGLTWAVTITDPASISRAAPAAATFTVAVVANELTTTYKWQESINGGTDYFDVTDAGVYSGSATATLTISNSTGKNTYKYRCTVTNGGTRAYSGAATLTVT